MIMKIRKYLICLLIIGVIVVAIYQRDYNINNIPKGNFCEEIISPNQKYALKSYIIDSNSSITADSTRVEFINYDTGKKYNIYYNYPEYHIDMKWIDNEIVEINGKRLNVFEDTYHWRKNQ